MAELFFRKKKYIKKNEFTFRVLAGIQSVCFVSLLGKEIAVSLTCLSFIIDFKFCFVFS